IVPMIDILFILLVFVIVSTQLKQPRPVIRIELPTVREIESTEITDRRSVLAVAADGRVTLDALLVPDGLLGSYLAAFQRENPGRKLELETDKELSVEKLLGVIEQLSEAGFPMTEVPTRIKKG